MPHISAQHTTPIFDSFRVRQVAGLFDLPPAGEARESFAVDVPGLDEPWTIGAIVGPSGSGKSTIARQAFGPAVGSGWAWARDRAVIDCLPDLPVKRLTGMLTAVGFSSPPSWLKPYQALSTGEQFRCDLARSLLEAEAAARAGSAAPPLVVCDEFTSVVDRTVAQVGSAAVSRALRRTPGLRFVAVTCHYDVLPWLEPDWVVDMATRTLTRGRLRRPEIAVEVVRCRPEAWRLFARHHYLSHALPPMSRCYLASWRGVPVAFCSVVGLFGHKQRRRIARIVVLPDYQGLGLGTRLAERVAQLECDAGRRVNLTTSHPAMIGHCQRSPRWRAIGVAKAGRAAQTDTRGKPCRSSSGRSVVSFEYLDERRGDLAAPRS